MKHRHLRSASLCPICGTAIHSEKALQNHIDVVHGDRQRKYICDLCGKKFTCKSNLTSHLRLTHNEKKERCKCCNECSSFALVRSTLPPTTSAGAGFAPALWLLASADPSSAAGVTLLRCPLRGVQGEKEGLSPLTVNPYGITRKKSWV